ncbi:FAD-dependent monooxygenase [Streptomyces sp. HNM0575]|uniref:FAD-dependent monooxygenase n=1 Tax=Streptomyces sp. HNM0575 TaxID=2716338 RepID=UPI001F110EDD|nr:FAD-dependent monooxygenase [Streptomyces sp. HNM0575]
MPCEEWDVVIAGAGPNGLMLACELGLAGVRPLVLERLPERTTENRANGLIGRVVLMLDRRGLYERLSGSAEPPDPVPRFVFGAMPLELGRLEPGQNRLYGLGVPQLRVEQVLEERALELGVEVRRGHELTGLSQDEHEVTAEVSGPGGPYRIGCRHLVGADGGRSLTRKLAGIGFPGVTRDDTVHRTAHATVPEAMTDPATGGLDVPGHGLVQPFIHHRTDRGLLAYAPFPGRAAMFHTTEWDHGDGSENGDGIGSGVGSGGGDRGGDRGGDGGPLTLEEMRASVRRVLGADVPLGPPEGDGPHLLRRLHGGNTRLADRFRAGRVLLVGDAAHVHSALGGPGLNLGLQDAVNLGWKLAAEVRGWAPPGLLGTYESERRPVAERVVMHTRAQSALIAPGSEVTALRELFTELLEQPGNIRHIADMMAGADVHYGTGNGDPHPLIGAWAPDLLLDTGAGRPVRLAELTRNARPLLLDLTGDGSYAGEVGPWDDRVDALAARSVRSVRPGQETGGTGEPGGTDGAGGPGGSEGPGGPDGAAGSPPATALLLRPDCHVAWASSAARPGPGEREGLRAALARWFGPAAAAPEPVSRAGATGR